MMSFRGNRLATGPVPMHILRLVGAINEYKGMQQLYHRQAPQVLDSLRQVAAVQSTESSNSIEGISVAPGKLHALMSDQAEPQTRPEGEIAGYRDVLATIHASYDHIPVTPGTILQLHRDLYRYVASEGGRWKSVDNTIDDVLPDGSHRVRLRTVTALATPHAMDELCSYLGQPAASDIDPLLLGATFVFDFLCIHPFRDGNGRMSRLLSLLLLYGAGYEVGRFISLERIISESKESYYESLAASSARWHEGTHDLLPWWEFYLGTILAAYREFEGRVGAVESGRRGAKTAMVRNTVARVVGSFSISELMRLCPGVSRDTVRMVLEKMRDQGLVECLGSGRAAVWRKTAAAPDFSGHPGS